MSQEIDRTSLQLAVAEELSKHRRLFRLLKKRPVHEQHYDLEKTYSEELELRKHPHSENNQGFS